MIRSKIFLAALAASVSFFPLRAADSIAPTAPTGVAASSASCGQVNLSWNASADEAGGSGMRAYLIERNDGESISIGSGRTAFSDTNYVKAATSYGYRIYARDAAGNQSLSSAMVYATTPVCPAGPGESIVDGAYIEPLGKRIATYGSRAVILYAKLNATTLKLDTWIHIRDEDTGQTSKFPLHTAPSYRQIESDYVLTSATDLWALSFNPYLGGQVLVSQYKLNGSGIPTSATLTSIQPFGDSQSHAKSMIRLKSGGIAVGWHQEGPPNADGSVNVGFGYRSPSGGWSTLFPVNLADTSGGNMTLAQMAIAQHPVDDSIWVFSKRDSFYNIAALHLREQSGALSLDWKQTAFISWTADGVNGVQNEFPYLSAVPDPTRNAILLAYQTKQEQFVFVDPLLNDGNSIFLKKAVLTVARIDAAGGKQFFPTPFSAERGVQFGLSALPDGAIWLAYQPINAGTLTWNEVFASRYWNNVWEAPVLVGYNYKNYDVMSAERDPGALIYKTGQAEYAFMAPDQKIHSFVLTGGGTAPPPDTTPPATSVISPFDGATVSGTVSVSATASDNTAVARVEFLVDGVLKSTAAAAPYSYAWNSSIESSGSHAVQSRAFDAAGNATTSNPVTVTVAAAPDTTPPTIALTAPTDGTTVPRNQTIVITASAADNASVSRVEFYVNGVLKCTDTSAAYSCAWKVPAKVNVQYRLQAKAFDAAGNAADRQVTVTSK